MEDATGRSKTRSKDIIAKDLEECALDVSIAESLAMDNRK